MVECIKSTSSSCSLAWETGKSLPDSRLMLELCGLLKINVNEMPELRKVQLAEESSDKRRFIRICRCTTDPDGRPVA